MYCDSEMFRKRYEVGRPMNHKTSFGTFWDHATSRRFKSGLTIITNVDLDSTTQRFEIPKCSESVMKEVDL